MKKQFLNDELENLSPLLRDLRQQDEGFRVPEGYFGALEDSVMNRLETTGNRRKPARVAKRGFFGRFSRPRAIWAAAAALTLVLAATWLFITKPEQQIAATQELTEEAIEAYVLENIHDFDAELLAAVPVGEQAPPETRPVTPTKTQTKQSDPIDDLSEEELELLLKEMSDEELENLLKT